MISVAARVSLPSAARAVGDAVAPQFAGTVCRERENVQKRPLRPIRSLRLAAVLAGIAVCAACTGHSASAPAGPQPGNAAPLAVGESTTPLPSPDSCHLGSRNGQSTPDPSCTPGAVNSAVTQANINSTVCKSGWTKTVRPAVAKTNKMKAATAKAYQLPASETGEYDHLVSLELGGAPDDPRNLWVEPGKIPNPKDAVENKLKDAVCSGLIPLAAAQTAIAHSWTTAYDDAGLRIANGKVCLRSDPSRCAGRQHGDDTGE